MYMNDSLMVIFAKFNDIWDFFQIVPFALLEETFFGDCIFCFHFDRRLSQKTRMMRIYLERKRNLWNQMTNKRKVKKRRNNLKR